MKFLITSISNFIQNEEGPTAVEYAVMVALIFVGIIGAVTAFGGAVAAWFQGVSPTVSALQTSP